MTKYIHLLPEALSIKTLPIPTSNVSFALYIRTSKVHYYIPCGVAEWRNYIMTNADIPT